LIPQTGKMLHWAWYATISLLNLVCDLQQPDVKNGTSISAAEFTSMEMNTDLVEPAV